MSKRNIIWVAAYPKSGNTWMCSVLQAAGRGHGYPHGEYDAYNLQAKAMQPLVCEAVTASFKNHPCSVVKTHAVYREEGLPHVFPDIEVVTAGFIHIYRNPLDVLLSYIGFTRIEYKTKSESEDYKDELFLELLGLPAHIEYDEWRTMGIDALDTRTLDHALDHFSERGLSIPRLEGMAGTWTQHLDSWRAAAKRIPGISLRYEDCLQDLSTFNQVADLFSFGASEITDAVAEVNLRARKFAQSDDGYRSIFYNKMQAHYFKDYFSSAAIARFFRDNEHVLKSAGYGYLLETV